MAFLDNSGDIILDAVLTDTGRYRLAAGNGTFKIAKFALGDDEVDYSLYDKTNSNGSAYYDLNILQTPVLEAFTNNGSSLKSKLLTITRNDLLYLSVLKLNNLSGQDYSVEANTGIHIIAVDEATETALTSSSAQTTQGIIRGFSRTGNRWIRIEQGLDTIEIPKTETIDTDLLETQYIVEIDKKLGFIIRGSAGSSAQQVAASESYIDDDGIASYFFTLDSNTNFVSQLSIPDQRTPNTDPEGSCVLSGPRGTKLQFSLGASLELRTNTSDYLFDCLGSTTTFRGLSVKYIDTSVTITGATTGYRLSVPIRFIKKV